MAKTWREQFYDWLIPWWSLSLPDEGRPCNWCLVNELPGPCRHCNDTGWVGPFER